MTPLAWTLLGVVIAASIAFPVALVAIARSFGGKTGAGEVTGERED